MLKPQAGQGHVLVKVHGKDTAYHNVVTFQVGTGSVGTRYFTNTVGGIGGYKNFLKSQALGFVVDLPPGTYPLTFTHKPTSGATCTLLHGWAGSGPGTATVKVFKDTFTNVDIECK